MREGLSLSLAPGGGAWALAAAGEGCWDGWVGGGGGRPGPWARPSQGDRALAVGSTGCRDRRSSMPRSIVIDRVEVVTTCTMPPKFGRRVLL